MPKTQIQAFRASVLHFLRDPAQKEDSPAYEYFEDGLLIVRDGLVDKVGPAAKLLSTLPAGVVAKEFTHSLILPGFVDTHTHFAQIEIIASPAPDTLEWLEQFTFPAERAFADRAHAERVAALFLEELLRRGTTTALVFGTVHATSVDAIFQEAEKKGLRLIAGKVLMDRNAPEYLRDTPESAYKDSKALIEKWHGKGRLEYAVTPRFAPTSSPEQLTQAGKLLREHPSVLFQSHLSETPKEVAWVKELFPKSRSYLDVYHQYGMCRPRSVFAHSIHVDKTDFDLMAKTGSAVAFCPTSNLFLGSGLFDLASATERNVKVSLGTDVGGGTSFSMLRTVSEAQKVSALMKHCLTGARGIYLATLGGAKALGLEGKIGNFLAGKEADFAVLTLRSPHLLGSRLENAQGLDTKLSALITLAEESTIKETYVMGQRAH